MSTLQYVLGVDGGNTKTIALVGRLDGAVVGVGRGGCSDIYTDPDPEVPLRELDSAVVSALQAAGVRPDQLAAGVFSLAGADWPEDFAFLIGTLERRGYGSRIKVVNDAVGALRAGAVTAPAVAVVCGTGAATAACSEGGQVWHSSWWQDPQGAHHLGSKTLHAVYRAELGIEQPTALREAVLRHFVQNTVEEVLHTFTARGSKHPINGKVATLARVLLDIAESGDAAARRIVTEHGAALGEYAVTAARQVGIATLPFTLALSGGVLRHPSRLLSDNLIASVQAVCPAAVPAFSQFEPAAGALFLSLEAAGVTVSETVLNMLAATYPEATLFAT